MPGLIRSYVRLTDRMSDYVGYLAAALIFVMGATLMFDAFTRNVIHMPVHWAVEFTQFTLAAYYFMGGPFTLKNNEHVRMDLIYSSLSERGKAKVDLCDLRLPDLLPGRDADRRHLQPAIRHRDQRAALLDLESIRDPDQGAAGGLPGPDADAGRLSGLQEYGDVARREAVMSYEMIALLMFGAMLVLLVTGQRVFAAIGFVAMAAALLLYGPGAIELSFNQVFKLFNWYAMLTLPMFIYMGYILAESGIAEDLYKMLHVWFGRLSGGLAVGTMFLMVIISAMNGLSVAGMAIGATIALPEMLRRGYDKILISGVVQGGSSLGILIPPSVVMVLYGMIARQPVSKLWFAGGPRPDHGGHVHPLCADPRQVQSEAGADGAGRRTEHAVPREARACCAPASFPSPSSSS